MCQPGYDYMEMFGTITNVAQRKKEKQEKMVKDDENVYRRN